MGLNYYPRPRYELLDPPNEFVTGAIGEKEAAYAHEFLADAVLEFEDKQLARAEERVRKIDFGLGQDIR